METTTMKSIDEWRRYWSNKTGENRIAMVDCCVDGVPLSADDYFRLIVYPNITQLEVETGNDVLEIGCGTGLHLDVLEPLARELAGTDLSPSLLAAYRGRAKLFACEAAEQPFDAQSFDRILMAGVALYFPTDEYLERVLVEIKRLLRPSGLALISDMLFGDFVSRSSYRVYRAETVMNMMDRLGVSWAINNQNFEKRGLNKRYNLVLRNCS
jgi:SAM-dependent methyltransferase